MKTYLVTTCMIALLALGACTSEDGNGEKGQQPQVGTARIALAVEGVKATETRSTGAALPTGDESKIARLTVAIFNADKTVNAIKTFSSTAGITFNCNPGKDCTGIVVANAPSGEYFAGVTDRDAFIAKTIALSDAQKAAELPMSGEMKSSTDASPFDLVTTGANALKVSLSRLVARVAITSIKTDFDADGQYSKATFKLKKIFLHNAKSASTVNPVTPATTVIVSGNTDAATAYLRNDINLEQAITTYTTPYWFYAFENDAATPTKLVLFGAFDPDGNGATASEDVYYPIVINKKQTGTIIGGGAEADRGTSTIKRNSTYTLTATIKGKGSTSPDVDITPASLSLTVEVAAWTLEITQDVTFD